MEQKLHDYFLGLLPEDEKARLLGEVERDGELRALFVEFQQRYSVLGLLPADGDGEYAREGRNRLRGMTTRKAWSHLVRYAAAAVLVTGVGFGVMKYVLSGTAVAEVVAPVGERLELSLPDGSKVWLAPRSRLSYPMKFPRRGREVELDGEALFDVAADPENPFEVHSGGYNVRVSGTVFNTACYDGVFETTLIEGVVEVYSEARPTERITLAPDQQACLEDGKLVAREFDASASACLRNGIYNFRDMTFGEIISRLEAWYDVSIEFTDKSLEQETFSAKFRVSDDLETILRALGSSAGFEFRRDPAGTITIH